MPPLHPFLTRADDVSQATASQSHEALVKTRLRRMQYRPGLLDGFLASTGLTLFQAVPGSGDLCRAVSRRRAFEPIQIRPIAAMSSSGWTAQ